MSNRLRILFHCGLEGPAAHVGQKALAAMQAYLVRPVQRQKWVTNGDWIKMGRPKFVQRQLRAESNGKATYFYMVDVLDVDMPLAKIQPPPGTALERAKWLWQHLPSEIRKHSQLLVMRENRSNCWRRSPANPHRQGWSKPDKMPATSPLGYEKVADSVWSFSKDLVGAALGIKEDGPAPPLPNKRANRYAVKPKTPYPYVKQQGQASSAEQKKPKLKVGIWS